MSITSNVEIKRVPIDPDLLTMPLTSLDKVRLKGSRCRSCGETFFGKRHTCEYCQSQEMGDVILSDRGKLYTYTIIRQLPSIPPKGVEPPYAAGFVELPEGVRVLSLLTECNFESLTVDMDMELVIKELYQDEQGNQVMTFMFKPTKSK